MSDEKKKQEGELEDEELDEASGGVAGIHCLEGQQMVKTGVVSQVPITSTKVPGTAPAELQIPGTGKGGVMGVRG